MKKKKKNLPNMKKISVINRVDECMCFSSVMCGSVQGAQCDAYQKMCINKYNPLLW